MTRLGYDPADQRVLDLGAGNGLGGEALRALGVGWVMATDIELAASEAAARDRPAVYEHYVVGDLADEIDELGDHDLTAVVACRRSGRVTSRPRPCDGQSACCNHAASLPSL